MACRVLIELNFTNGSLLPCWHYPLGSCCIYLDCWGCGTWVYCLASFQPIVPDYISEAKTLSVLSAYGIYIPLNRKKSRLWRIWTTTQYSATIIAAKRDWKMVFLLTRRLRFSNSLKKHIAINEGNISNQSSQVWVNIHVTDVQFASRFFQDCDLLRVVEVLSSKTLDHPMKSRLVTYNGKYQISEVIKVIL